MSVRDFSDQDHNNDFSLIVESLIDDGCDLNVPFRWRGVVLTPLLFAVGKGDRSSVQLLLGANARVNHRYAGTSALHEAASRQNADMVDLLIRNGADVTLLDSRNCMPFKYAADRDNDTIAIALINAGAPITDTESLCRASALSPTVIEMLRARQINVRELRDSTNKTPCHIAADRRCLPNVFRMLVYDIGIDVNARDNTGQTCAHICASHDDFEALQLCLEAGVSIDAADANGRSSLHIACMEHNELCSWALLVAGANVDLQDNAGESPMHLVLSVRGRQHRAFYDGLRALVAAGASLDALDFAGNSTRSLASHRGLWLPAVDDIDTANKTPGQIEGDRRRVAAAREEVAVVRGKLISEQFLMLRKRGLEICMALGMLKISTLEMCEILFFACPRQQLVPFHLLWALAKTVRHFHDRNKSERSTMSNSSL
jgi:ankyrin repeat protein